MAGDLEALVAMEAPVASVALDAPSALEDAAAQLDARWRNARRDLESAGFPESGLARLDGCIADLHHDDGAALMLFQSGDGPPFVELLDDPIRHELAVVDELARTGPVIESRQRSVPHVMVVADRAGADLIGIGSPRGPIEVEVEGERLHLHRGHPGGWSQRRFQQRAENRWEDNARDAAEAVAELAREIDARVVTVAGDGRAVGFLLEHLPADVSGMATKLDGQSADLVAEETVRAVADVVARDTRAILERFREEHGRGEAASGPSETLSALSSGRVEVLLVHDDPEDDRRAHFDPESLWCTVDDEEPRPGGPGAARDGRLVDVAIRSALLGDAEVRIVPEHSPPASNLGALLRW